jgi:DNA-binding NarL/FixJ family response regulator
LKRIRVLLADMPPMLRDIVTDAVSNEPDVEVLGGLGPGESLEATLERVQPDVLIIGRRPPDLTVAEEVWLKWPRVKVLMIAGGGRSAVLYLLRPAEIALGDVSPEGLAAAIRGSCTDGTRS